MAGLSTFYADNYNVIYWKALTAFPEQRLGANNPRCCRFCGRSRHEVKFKKAAHTISKMIGNVSLFSLDECDECNLKFALFEDDFGKFTMPDRTFGQVAGYKKIPTLRTGDGNRVEISPGQWQIDVQPQSPSSIEIEDQERSIKVEIKLQPYRPLAVYKALVKMAVSVAPEEELPFLKDARDWLAAKTLEGGLAGNQFGLFTVYFGMSDRIKHPEIILLRKKRSRLVPNTTFVLRFGLSQYQIFPICCDFLPSIPEGGSIELAHYMPPQMTSDDESRRVIRNYDVYDLHSPIRIERTWKGRIKLRPESEIIHEYL